MRSDGGATKDSSPEKAKALSPMLSSALLARQACLREPQNSNASFSMRLRVCGKATPSTPLPQKHIGQMVSRPSFSSTYLSMLQWSKVALFSNFSPRAALRSAYCKDVHVAKASSETSITLAGSTNPLIPEYEKQPISSLFKPSLSLTEAMFAFSNAFSQTVATVRGKVQVRAGPPRITSVKSLFSAVPETTTKICLSID